MVYLSESGVIKHGFLLKDYKKKEMGVWGQGRYNLLHREHYSCILIHLTLFLDSFYIKWNSESFEACYSSDPIIWIPAVHRGLHYERAAKRNRLNALNKSINNILGEAWIAALVFRAMLKRCKYYIQMHIIYKLNVEVFVWRWRVLAFWTAGLTCGVHQRHADRWLSRVKKKTQYNFEYS